MKRVVFFAGLLGGLSPLCLLGVVGSDAPPQALPHRSPLDLAVLPAGDRVLTANHTADSVSLVDLREGKVVDEQKVGRKPAAIACSRDGKRAAVSNLWSSTVTLLQIHDRKMHVEAEIAVGALPRGLVFGSDGRTLYVALAGSDEVAALDWKDRKVTQRWPAAREPRELAVSPDGRWLAALSTRSGHVRCWETQSGKLHWERNIQGSFNLRGLTFSPDGTDLFCTFIYNRERPVTQNNIAEGWMIDNRVARLPLGEDKQSKCWQMSLDMRGQAAGDPHGVAAGPDARLLAIAASGTHELLILEPEFIPWSPGEPGDFIDVTLEVGRHKMRRVELGGRPLTVAFADQGQMAVVANYLLDRVQVVDVKAGKLIRSISLGGPAQPALARQGEMIFYDALRSHHQWFSCNTCHVEGHTCGINFDTLNDDSYGNPKLTPTLRNVTRTAPYTWHGWQKQLSASIEKSLEATMFGPKFKTEDVKALLAFFETLEHPPNPQRGALSPAAERGKALFEGKARCARCHKGELYFSETNYDLKLGYDGSPFDRWNAPSLLGLWDRGPYMHDGRAETLEELLRKHHAAEQLGGEKLTDQERKDMIEFLKSL